MEYSVARERKMRPEKQKSLSQVLQEEEREEPLVYSERRQQHHYRLSPLKGKRRTRLREAAARILEPRLHSCSRPRPITVRYLVHLDRISMANLKRSEHLRKSQVEYVDESKKKKRSSSSAWQKAAEALLNAFGFSHQPAAESASLFRFNKNRGETGETGELQRKNKYNLLKSILRRVGPSKDCVHKDTVSEGFSNGPRALSRPQMEGRVRIYDIVRWNSFEESQFLDISRSSSGREKESRSRISSMGRKVCGRGKEGEWMEDISFSTSSSSTWLESSLDGYSGSNTYTPGRSSSSGCSEIKGSDSDSDLFNLGESYFSLETDQNGGAGDFHHSPRSAVNMISTKPQMYDAVCNWYEGSVSCIQNDNKLASSPLITIPLNFMPEMDEATSADDVHSDSTDIEDKECVENEEVEQQSPISVLDSGFDFEESLANIQRARKHLLRKICEYEQLAEMNTVRVLDRSHVCLWGGGGGGEELLAGGEWERRFSVEREEIGFKIEVAIFRLLLEELLLDLLA